MGGDKEIARTKEALDKAVVQMTNLQGVFRTNAESIGWLLRLLQARDGHDPQSTQAISAARKSSVSNTTFVEETKCYLARVLPQRKQRARGLQKHIDITAPAL